MKNLLVALIAAILGLCIGIAATAGVFTFNVRQTLATPTVPPNGAKSDLSVTASAAFINSQIQPVIKSTGLLKQASVSLDAPNTVRVNGAVDTTILGQRVTANPIVTMRVAIKSNRVTLTVEKIETGNPAIPASMVSGAVETLRSQAEDLINRQVQRALQGTSLKISNVRATPIELTMDLVSQ